MADLNTINTGVYHLSEHPELYEPAISNAFEFIAPQELNKILATGISPELATEDDYFNDLQDVIKISVDEASVPHFNLEKIEIRRANSTMKFAGTPSFDDGSLKLNDYVGARTKDILMAWRNKVYDVEKDVVNLASNYKFDCQLIEYTRDYSKTIRSWTLKGCWPMSISEGNFSHSSPDKRQIDVTIVYDRAIPKAEKL